jgi:serine/threonine-protein kinase
MSNIINFIRLKLHRQLKIFIIILGSVLEGEIMSLVGKSIGRYRILEQLGQGGMAVVYKAYDTRLERDVAMKVIRTENIPPSQLNKLLKRFEREAKSQAKFDHPHIVPVHDYGEHEGSPYLVMAYRPGGTMKQITGKAIPYQKAAQLLAPIASALSYAHKRNVLHRDVKPSNILISEDGVPAITDFGIAKLLETEEATLTGTGVGIGTPEYMAPEQWRGKSVHQTDIFALGVVFYELVTGRKPYTAETPFAVALKQTSDPLPRPSEFALDLPEDVEKVIYKALALEPEDRYKSMADFCKVLGELSLIVRLEEREEVAVVDDITKISEPPVKPVMERLGDSELETSDDLITLPVREKDRKKVSRFAIVLGAVVIIILAVVGIGFRFFEDDIWALLARSTPTVTVGSTQAEMPSETPIPTLGVGSVLVREMDNMEMVYVPAGEFEMGGEDGRSDENPVHTVYLDAFWIDKHEVTNAQYALCVGARKCVTPRGGFPDTGFNDHPVVQVDWYDAEDYCEWVGGRLPTEAEWEKAARGGQEDQRFPWGNEYPNCTILAENGAQYSLCNGETVRVGSFTPNGYGTYEMAGNVSEWVADWYDENYYSTSPAENPPGPSDGSGRVIRGGSWKNLSYDLRVYARDNKSLNAAEKNLGFRCASDAP